jgi:hypothetical protein
MFLGAWTPPPTLDELNLLLSFVIFFSFFSYFLHFKSFFIDTSQTRLDLDFDIKFSTVQFFAIEHNFKSNRWIEFTRRF